MKDKEGELAVRLARKAVEAETHDRDPNQLDVPASFQEKRGVFVTLNTHPDHELRGCIGYPEPVYSLGSALLKAAQGACHDPRFPPLRADEVKKVVIEVSILNPPEEVEGEGPELSRKIQVGRDGLIAERGPFRGLLLPQVPVEQGWDAETFLCQTCMKAGLPPDCWMDQDTRILWFQAEVFGERAPGGEVVRKE
ncbi:MAG: TIGR00296 family protein [Methanomassiliicoccales archaeon]